MDASKAYMEKNGIGARISFQDGAAHTVKLIKDKEDSIPDATSPGGRKSGMKYLVEENGEQKTIFSGSVGLIAKLSECNEGDVVTIQMKKANNKSYYTVTRDGAEVTSADDIGVGEDAPAAEEAPAW